jgi:hypothetical protein
MGRTEGIGEGWGEDVGWEEETKEEGGERELEGRGVGGSDGIRGNGIRREGGEGSEGKMPEEFGAKRRILVRGGVGERGFWSVSTSICDSAPPRTMARSLYHGTSPLPPHTMARPPTASCHGTFPLLHPPTPSTLPLVVALHVPSRIHVPTDPSSHPPLIQSHLPSLQELPLRAIARVGGGGMSQPANLSCPHW